MPARDRIIELDLDVVAIDGSLHKAPCGGEGTGKSPVDRAKLGWKWSVASERSGIPIGWSIDAANRNDVKMQIVPNSWFRMRSIGHTALAGSSVYLASPNSHVSHGSVTTSKLGRVRNHEGDRDRHPISPSKGLGARQRTRGPRTRTRKPPEAQ